MFISPAVAGNEVYVGSCSGTFFAFEAQSGKVVWQYDTARDGTPAQFHGDALVTEDLVVVGSDARPTAYLYAFERDDGEVRWKRAFPRGVAVDVRRHGDAVLAVSMNGEVVTIDLATGDVVWRSEPETAEVGLPTDPALREGRYYVPRRSGRLEAYDVGRGERLWSRELPASPNTSVVAGEAGVAVGTADGRLLRFDENSGEPSGELAVGAFLYGELVLAGNCLLVLAAPAGGEEAAGHEVVCVEPDLGSVRWRYREEVPGAIGTFEPLVRNDEIVVGVEGKLIGLSLADGTVRWTRSVEGLPRGLGHSPTMLYVGALGGTVTAWPWHAEDQDAG